MGLHIGIDAAHEYTVVQYIEFVGDCAVPFGDGRDDLVTDVA